MHKSLALIALTLVAIAVAPREASALTISTGLAEALCKGQWVHNMETGVRICAYCKKVAGGIDASTSPATQRIATI